MYFLLGGIIFILVCFLVMYAVTLVTVMKNTSSQVPFLKPHDSSETIKANQTYNTAEELITTSYRRLIARYGIDGV